MGFLRLLPHNLLETIQEYRGRIIQKVYRRITNIHRRHRPAYERLTNYNHNSEQNFYVQIFVQTPQSFVDNKVKRTVQGLLFHKHIHKGWCRLYHSTTLYLCTSLHNLHHLGYLVHLKPHELTLTTSLQVMPNDTHNMMFMDTCIPVDKVER